MKILTPTGYKEITDLSIGDAVIGANGTQNTLLGKIEFTKAWFDEQELNEWKWYLINGTYKIFHNQNIYVSQGDYNLCHGFELKVGWSIVDENGSDIIINSIEDIVGDDIWYKFDIDNDHSFVGDNLCLHNASRYWVGAGANANWNATGNTNWSATTGGANNASVPGSSDDVTFDGAGGGNSNSTISATITILSFTKTSGYTFTITRSTTLTVAGNFTDHSAGAWAGTGPMTISAASTITSGGVTWSNAVAFSGANTKTLSGGWTISGALTISAATVINWTTNETLSCGGLTMSGACSGSAKIILTGGTWSGSSALSNSLDLQGTITATSTALLYNGGTLTWVSGTITTTGGTLTINGSATIATSGMSWNNVTLSAAQTLTLNSLLTVSGTLTINATIAITFAGSGGFTAATFSVLTADARTHTLVNGVAYTVTGAFNAFRSRMSGLLTFTSDHASARSILTLNQGAICNVLGDFTRINASAGRPILSFNGTMTDNLNVFGYTDVQSNPIPLGRLTRRNRLYNRAIRVQYSI